MTTFHRPHDAHEAAALKRELGPNAAFLAGGTWLNHLHGPTELPHFILLDGLDLRQVSAGPAGLLLGAGCTLQDLLDHADVPPSIRAACRHVHNRNIRNQATLGGQLGARQANGDLLPVLIALDATLQLGNGGVIGLEEWLGRPAGDDLLTAVRVRADALLRGWSVQAEARTANDHATVTCAVTCKLGEDPVARVVVGGTRVVLGRLPAVEHVICERPDRPWLGLGELVAPGVKASGCVRGSAAYKARLAGVLVERAVKQACGGAE